MAYAQQFSVSLGGTAYQFKLRWCAPADCWIANISDQDGVAILCGVPLITGAGLLEQFRYLGIPGELLVQTDTDADAVPTFDNLGLTSHLFFIPLVTT
jgi:hypothetical protein